VTGVEIAEASVARLYDGGFIYKQPIDTDTSEALVARLYDGGFTYKQPIDTDTTEAPATKRAHARCGPQSLTPFAPCGPYVACARLAAAPSSPAPNRTAPQPHASPASSVALASLRSTDSLARAPRGRLTTAARRRAPPLRFVTSVGSPPV
jgi:hypothetical protein